MNHAKTEGQVAPAAPPRETASAAWWIQGAALAALLAFLYAPILTALVRQWWNDDNYSHGFLIAPFAAFVIWFERKKLAEIESKPSWLGLVVIAGALCVLIAGQFGAELFLSRTSLIFLLAGWVICFLGWRFFRALLFPWFCLFLMIPLPAIIFNQVAFPLQFLASQLASGLLELFGVPVLREGNVIHLPAMDLEVVEACSGIRSLVSLGTLALIYGYFLERRISRRVILALAAIPIAVLANAFRIVGTGLAGHFWDPDKAMGFFHTFSGWVIFVLSLAMLLGLQGALRLWDRWRGVREAS